MIFPENFFQDEYRNGFLVPQMMKRAWRQSLNYCRSSSISAINMILPILLNMAHCLAQYATRASFHGMMMWILLSNGLITTS